MAGRPSAVTRCKRWASSIFQLRPFHLAEHGIAERRTLTADALLSAVKARSWPFCSNAMLLTPRLKNPGIVLTGDGEVETIHSSHPETAQPYDNPTLIACYTSLLSEEWHPCCSISALRAPSALHLSALASLSPFVPPGLSGIELREPACAPAAVQFWLAYPRSRLCAAIHTRTSRTSTSPSCHSSRGRRTTLALRSTRSPG